MALDTPPTRRRRSIVNAIVTFTLCVLAIAIWAQMKATHPVIWIVALVASIPIFAAVVGAFLNNGRTNAD